MIILSLSDLHLADGQYFESGEVNVLEDFTEDERFYEFCQYYSSGKYAFEDVHLVLNGDIFNLIQIKREGTFTHIIDEEHTLHSLEAVKRGHPLFFEALREFASRPKKQVTYIIGNHDANMAFPAAQEWFKRMIGAEVYFTFTLEIAGVHFEHGHRFEAVNTVPPHKYFVEDELGRKILNLPWGSLFCIFVLPILKKSRPLIDRVRPMNFYIKWLLIHDIRFFIKMVRFVVRYLWQTRSEDFTSQNRNFRTTWKVIKQGTVHVKYEKMARRILKKNRDIHTVVMGHTHIKEWRRFPEGRYYFNTGTWTPNPGMDIGQHEESKKLCYCFLDIHPPTKQLRSARLSFWLGKWRPYRDEFGN